TAADDTRPQREGTRMAKRVWLVEIGLGLAVVLVLLVTSRDRFFLDPGTFWHTVTGERILTGGFFDTDPYSYTFAGQPWVPSQWLAEVVMALLHRLAGLDALLWATLALLGGLYG